MGDDTALVLTIIAASIRAIWFGVSVSWLNNLEGRMRELEYQRLEETE